MKNKHKFFGIAAVLALCALVFIGCEKELESAAAPIANDGVNSITITGIPSQYRSMEIRVMSSIDPHPGEKVADGYNEVSKGRAVIPLLDQNMEDWTGSGNYFIILDLDKVYVYTDGSPVPLWAILKDIPFKTPALKLILADSGLMTKAVQNRTGSPLQAYLQTMTISSAR